MLKFFMLLAIAATGGVATSCHGNVQKSVAGEEDNPPCNITFTGGQRAFVSGTNAFAFNFLATVNKEDTSGKSFVFSPLSIVYALGMVNDAAEGLTRNEFQRTLGFGNAAVADINMFCKALVDSLPMVDPNVQFHIANAVFVNRDYTLKEQFLQDMHDYYGAQAEALDFYSPQALGCINSWCNSHTNGMIPSILSRINPLAVSYLLNAIYFKADWAEPFKESHTKTDTFHTASGPVMLPLMRKAGAYRYMKNDIFEALDIPYGGGNWSMTVLLPERGRSADEVVGHLANDGMSFLSQLEQRDVDLKLPRFETESETSDLIGTMRKMGIHRAFDGAMSEIPNMCDVNVYISMMLQKAHIKVDEKGSEAAAVTVVEVFRKSSAEPVRFYANRPFVYVIREASSGAVLFVGKFTGR